VRRLNLAEPAPAGRQLPAVDREFVQPDDRVQRGQCRLKLRDLSRRVSDPLLQSRDITVNMHALAQLPTQRRDVRSTPV
jgi:hypothetical protein